METKPQDSIKRRYGVTLLAQIVRWGLSFIVTAGFLPRRLGPVVYGNLNFITNVSGTWRGFLDPSTQEAFFTFSSQDQRSGPLTKLYSMVLLFQMILMFGFMGLAAFFHKLDWFLPGQRLDQIFWITLLEWSVFLAMSLQRLGDCKGQTVVPQLIGVSVSLINMLLLVGLFFMHQLTLRSYVLVGLVTAGISVVGLSYWLFGVHGDLCWNGTLAGQGRAWIKRWWTFSAPLVVLEFCTPVISFVGTYMIQIWYGSAEQGHFSLALRWSGPALAFTSAGLMIFWREIASRTAAGDLVRAKQIYVRFNHMLLFLALTLAYWLCFSSSTLILRLAGAPYAPAIPVLMLMAFYPVIQTSGQLTATSFKATQRTVLFRNINIALIIPELLVTYFLLAPTKARIPGWQLGALGMAIRMVVYGFFVTEVFSWFDCRYYGIRYGPWIARKIGMGVFLAIASILTLKYANTFLLNLRLSQEVSLSFATLLYFGGVGATLLVWPKMAGLSRDEVSEFWTHLKSFCQRPSLRNRFRSL